MIRHMLMITVAVGAGCAVTPESLERDGISSVHELKLPQDFAAACVARNLDMERGLFAPTVRPIAAGTTEITARVGPDHAPVYVQVTQSGPSSRAKISTSSRFVQDREAFTRGLVRDC